MSNFTFSKGIKCKNTSVGNGLACSLRTNDNVKMIDGQMVIENSGKKASATIDSEEYSGFRIELPDGKVYVDGREEQPQGAQGEKILYTPTQVKIAGNVDRVETMQADVTVEGQANKVSTVSGDITIHSSVQEADSVSGNITVHDDDSTNRGRKRGRPRGNSPHSPASKIKANVIGDKATIYKK